MTSFTLNESPREAALREAARELKFAAIGLCASMIRHGTESKSPLHWDRIQDAIAKMEGVL